MVSDKPGHSTGGNATAPFDDVVVMVPAASPPICQLDGEVTGLNHN